MDEEVDIIRGLSAGGFFEYHGEIFDVPSIKIDAGADRAAARS